MDVDHNKRRRIHAEVLEAIDLTPKVKDEMLEGSIAAYNRGEKGRRYWRFIIPTKHRGSFSAGQIEQAVVEAIIDDGRFGHPYVYRLELPGRVFSGSVTVRVGAKNLR